MRVQNCAENRLARRDELLSLNPRERGNLRAEGVTLVISLAESIEPQRL